MASLKVFGMRKLHRGIKFVQVLSERSYSAGTAAYFFMMQSRGTCFHVSSFQKKSLNCYKYLLPQLAKQTFQCGYKTSSGKSIIQKDASLQAKRVPRKKPTITTTDLDEEKFRVVAYSSAEEYNIPLLSAEIDKEGIYKQLPLPEDVGEVLHVTAKYPVDKEPRHMFFFREGSVVFWNMPEVEQKIVLKFLKPFERVSYDENLVCEEKEFLEYLYSDSETKLSKGRILLKEGENTNLETYAFSNALIHSVKLALWEYDLEAYIKSIYYLEKDMRDGKKVRLSRDELFRKRGELFMLRHAMNLRSDLLDIPDFYWNRDSLEVIYNQTCNHLNIPKRIKVMNERFSNCSELIDLLSNHFTDKHHINLEMMIIALIVVEVILGCAQFLQTK